MTQQISDEQWVQFEEEGYLRLGKVMDDDELEGLQQRIDDIMLGKVKVHDQMYMQLDSETGDYSEKRITMRGHEVATLNYRKIQDLEFDPLFLSYIQKSLFREICTRAYGSDTPISCYRAMFMNKPAGKGTHLPWHQDRFDFFDRDPIATVWMALDPATVENGCVEVVPGSHRSTFEQDDSVASAFLTEEQATAVLAESEPEYLTVDDIFFWHENVLKDRELTPVVGYTHWLLTNGKQGETPTGDMRRCIELFWQIEETPDEAEQIRLFGEILELNRKNLWVIGTIGSMPSIMLVHNTFRNVPEVAMASWSVRTPANTAVECYAIEP